MPNKKRTESSALAEVAERVGFEPTYQLITGNSISSRARYGRFATSPSSEGL